MLVRSVHCDRNLGIVDRMKQLGSINLLFCLFKSGIAVWRPLRQYFGRSSKRICQQLHDGRNGGQDSSVKVDKAKESLELFLVHRLGEVNDGCGVLLERPDGMAVDVVA